MNSTNPFNEAKSFANKFRHSSDIEKKNIQYVDKKTYHGFLASLYQEKMEISAELTPDIFKALKNTCSILNVPIDKIKAFIDPEYEIQARCYTNIAPDETILIISSRLINLLNQNELQFVMGHEIGHYLLEHGDVDHNNKDYNNMIGFNMQSRYKEISADRIGLLSCNNINSAFSSIFKLMTGLDDKHLRFDISAYISQIDQQTNKLSTNGLYSTHPSNMIRCRALLWFSMTDIIARGIDYFNSNEINKLDQKIDSDLASYIDGPIREQIKKYKDDYKLWYLMREIIKDGLFDKNEQNIFKDIFDNKKLNKIINFFKGMSVPEIKEIIESRILEKKSILEALLPDSYQKECKIIEKNIIEKFENSK